MKKLVVVMTAASIGTAPLTVQATAVIASTEPTQILNNIQLVASLEQQIQAAVNTLNQYKLMQEEMQARLPKMIWSDALSVIKDLQSITLHAKSWAWSLTNFEEEFRRSFPSYDDFLKDTGFDPDAITKQYSDWNANLDHAITDAMKAAKVSGGPDALKNAEKDLEKLKNDSLSADTEKDVLTAGVNFAHFQSRELLALRQLMAQQVSLHANYQAKMEAQDAQRKATSQNLFGNPAPLYTGKEKAYP